MRNQPEWHNVNIFLHVDQEGEESRQIFIADFTTTRPFTDEIIITNMSHQEIYRYLCKNCLTDLNLAALTNNTRILAEIISSNEDLNAVDRIGSCALHYAVRFGSINTIRMLLMDPTILINIQDSDGNTPLFIAVKFFINVEIVKTLIDAGAEVNILNSYKDSALYCTIVNLDVNMNEKLFICRMLLEHGADPNIEHNFWKKNIFFKLLMLNITCTEDEMEDYLNLICLFLAYGADVCGPYEFAPYAYALMHCRDNVTELLYDYVADFNQVCFINGDTSLFLIAVTVQNKQVFKMIRDGADINFANGITTCLIESITWTDSELYKYFWFNSDKIKSINKLGSYIYNFIEKCKFPLEQFLEALYLIFDCEAAVTQLREEGNPLIYLALYDKFKLLKIPREDRVKILYLILPHVETMFYDHLYFFFKTYGFNEEFEAFLKITIRLIHFCDLSNHLGRICYPSLNYKYYTYDVDTPPSLIELSRDAIRKRLEHRCGIGSSYIYFTYYNKVQQFDAPQCIKDIICLKKLITYVKKIEFPDKCIKLVFEW